MRLWPFRKGAKQESPLTLNKNFYLSILAGPGPLPPMLQVVNPDGSNGAVAGFGAPLSEGVSKDMLNQPLLVGSYAITTKNRDTVLLFDLFELAQVPHFRLPEDPKSLAEADLVGEKLALAKGAQYLMTLTFKGYSPELFPSVRFFLDVASRIAELSNGVIADPLAEVYRDPKEFRLPGRLDPRLDFREIGSIKAVALSDGLWISTRGLAKFNLPEFEMFGIPMDLRDGAARMLIAAAQQTLLGLPMKAGETAFAPGTPLYIVVGSKKSDEWGDRPVLEFTDEDGRGAAKGVRAWVDLGN